MEMYENTIYVEDAIALTKQALVEQGASAATQRYNQSIFRALASFANNNFHGEYTPQIGDAFLKLNEQRVPVFLAQSTFRNYANAIARINHVLEGDVEWQPCHASKDYAKSRFEKETRAYAEYLSNSGKTKKDVRARMHVVTRFLQFVDNQGILDLRELTPQHIYAAFQAATDKSGFRRAISPFLQYAYRYKITADDLSCIMPNVKRREPAPSVYSMEEIQALLDSIDRTKKVGKRNYAMLLIAARLGLRSCDIAALTFEDVDFDNNTIHIIQEKTGRPQVLPLLPEIKDAILDYIETARPKSASDCIFLTAVMPLGRPLDPKGIYTTVSNQFQKAGVLFKGRKHGPHVLRSSLATVLLSEGTDYPVIQRVLGHTSQTAAKSYVKIDIEHLRPLALEPPAPTGAFKAMLEKAGAVA